MDLHQSEADMVMSDGWQTTPLFPRQKGVGRRRVACESRDLHGFVRFRPFFICCLVGQKLVKRHILNAILTGGIHSNYIYGIRQGIS